MNLSPVFTFAARAESAYSAAQDWIRNDAPVLEQRLKRFALVAAINVLEFTLIVIDWLSNQLEKAPEYQLKARLTYVLAKRFVIRQGIKAARFNGRYGITAKASKVWSRKGEIATKTLDKVFCLN